MALLAERTRRRPDAGRADPPSGREQVDRTRHPHQLGRRRLGAARSHPQDVPPRAGDGGAGPPGRGLVPGARLRPAGPGRPQPRVRRHVRGAGVGDDAVTVLDQVADPRAAPAAFRGRVPGRRGVPAAAAARGRGDGVGRRRRARRVAGARAGRHPRPLPRRARRHPRPGLRGRDLGHTGRTCPRAREDCSATTRRPAPCSTASPTSWPPTRSSSPSTLDPDREYAVNVVNAPVFDHTGHVTLVLSLTGFGRPLRGAEVVAAGDAPARRHTAHHRRPLPRALPRPRPEHLDARPSHTYANLRCSGLGALSRVARCGCRGRSGAGCRCGSSVSAPSRTMAVPFTSTCSMPSASA